MVLFRAVSDEERAINRVREIRTTKGLSRSAVAAALGTTPFEIERIEVGEDVRYDTIMRLAQALETEPEALFPAAKPLLRKLRDRTDLRELEQEETQTAFAGIGIDTAPEQWSLKIRLRGGAEVIYPITSSDRKRIFSAVQDKTAETARFFVAHSTSCAFAVNLDCVTFAHVLFDSPTYSKGPELAEAARVFIRGARKPLLFDVDPCEEDDDSDGQLRHLMEELEIGPVRSDFVWFDDTDGESAMFQVKTLALVEVPLWAVLPMQIDEEIAEGSPPPTNDNDIE
ncbi:MAG TPA: helix-turn-helix transcriptional regulator [Polyangia bacterium]|nr:helix-turn-helix transcriptional regulator [Polyangia bacterium]